MQQGAGANMKEKERPPQEARNRPNEAINILSVTKIDKSLPFDNIPDSICGFFGTDRSFGMKCRKCKLLIACVDACQEARHHE